MTTRILIATLKHVTCVGRYLVVASTKEEAVEKAATATGTDESRWTVKDPSWVEDAENEVAWLYLQG